MFEEKVDNGKKWISCNKIKFRIEGLRGKKAIVWTSKDGVDLGFSLIMYDFIDRCRDELNLHLEVDLSWHNQRGFVVSKNELNLLIGEIVKFIDDWEIEADLSMGQLSEEEWYR